MKIVINSFKSSLWKSVSGSERYGAVWRSWWISQNFPKHISKSLMFFLCLVLYFLVGNNVYVPASFLALLYCSNAYSYLYFNSSIAAKLCLHIWGESASGRFVLLPDFLAQLSTSVSEATRSVTQRWVRKHAGAEMQRMKNSLSFVTAWRYCTEIWNVLR